MYELYLGLFKAMLRSLLRADAACAGSSCIAVMFMCLVTGGSIIALAVAESASSKAYRAVFSAGHSTLMNDFIYVTETYCRLMNNKNTDRTHVQLIKQAVAKHFGLFR